jgi:hypothetical protein
VIPWWHVLLALGIGFYWGVRLPELWQLLVEGRLDKALPSAEAQVTDDSPISDVRMSRDSSSGRPSPIQEGCD